MKCYLLVEGTKGSPLGSLGDDAVRGRWCPQMGGTISPGAGQRGGVTGHGPGSQDDPGGRAAGSNGGRGGPVPRGGDPKGSDPKGGDPRGTEPRGPGGAGARRVDSLFLLASATDDGAIPGLGLRDSKSGTAVRGPSETGGTSYSLV